MSLTVDASAPAYLPTREAELARLRARVKQAADGRPGFVVIEGDSGMGKTMLLRELLGEVNAVVLQATGDENERSLPYGVIDQLCHSPGLLEWLVGSSGLPAPRAEKVAREPLDVGADALGLLRRIQADEPVVIALDDAHLADIPSQLALLFALRRLDGERVLTVLTYPPEADSPLLSGLGRLVDGTLGLRLRLAGLTGAQVQDLVAGLGVGGLPRTTIDELREHTGGNPLHIRAVIEEVGTDSFGRATASPPLVPAAMSRQVRDRLAFCTPEARRLLAAAAVVGMRCPLAMARRLSGVDETLPALQCAVDIDLVRYRERQIEFPHPMARASVYHSIGIAERSELHTAASRLVDDEATTLRHLAAAATEEDDNLASAVAAFAERQAGIGAWPAAAAMFGEAARLAPGRDKREACIVEAIDCLLSAGDAEAAPTVAGRIGDFANPARACYVQGRLASAAGRAEEAERALTRAFELCSADRDAVLAGRIATALAALHVYLLRPAAAGEWGHKANRTTAGRSDPAAAEVSLGLALSGRTASTGGHTKHRLGQALTHVAAGAFHRAREDLAGLADDEGTREPAGVHAGGLFLLSLTEQRVGAWDDAITHAEQAMTVSRDAGGRFPRAALHAAAAGPLAARGQWPAADGHVRAATDAADGPLDAALANAVRALVARARGEHQVVLGVLDDLQACGLYDPEGALEWLWPWREMQVEAAIGCGRLDLAEDVLVRLETLASAASSLPAMAGAARLRGELAAAAGAAAHAHAAFRRSLELLARTALPFERALAHASFGAFLRRAGKRSVAAAELRAARTDFERLGAQPYVERCDRELASAGLAPRRRGKGEPNTLTPQESSVAGLVAQGKSNRAVAAELVLSINTIEYHLKNVYAKLGISSRSQLVIRLGERAGVPDALARGTA